MDSLQPGQLFAGRYRIERFLAKGGFGAVYVAEHIETEARVALKTLFAHVLQSQDAVEKFWLEARVAGRASSEHIVRVLDAGLDAETKLPFLVMELLQGEDLDALVTKHGPIAPRTLVTYMRQIASALDKAHGYIDKDGTPRPIVHRDLKPANLFLTHRETGEPVIKILDFGIAKVASDTTEISQEVRGTPIYMAFEQASAGRITPQTDIWALGLIAFYLLTGDCYWKAVHQPEAAIMALLGEVLTLPLDPPSERARQLGIAASLPAGFDAWFARCVNRDVSARFATAGECAAALSAALGDHSTNPYGPAVDYGAFAATAHAMPATGAIGAPAAPGAPGRNTVLGSTTAPIELGVSKVAAAQSRPANRKLVVALGVLAVGGALAALSLRGGEPVEEAPVGVNGTVAPSAGPKAAGPGAVAPTLAPATIPTSVATTAPALAPAPAPAPAPQPDPAASAATITAPSETSPRPAVVSPLRAGGRRRVPGTAPERIGVPATAESAPAGPAAEPAGSVYDER